jgi:hypothetical protein
MELESIILLTQLYLYIIPNFQHNESDFTAYTDSKVALDWSRSPKLHENKMVRRRVTKIKEVLNPRVQLHHVRSEENPADPARTISAQNANNHTNGGQSRAQNPTNYSHQADTYQAPSTRIFQRRIDGCLYQPKSTKNQPLVWSS